MYKKAFYIYMYVCMYSEAKVGTADFFHLHDNNAQVIFTVPTRARGGRSSSAHFNHGYTLVFSCLIEGQHH